MYFINVDECEVSICLVQMFEERLVVDIHVQCILTGQI